MNVPNFITLLRILLIPLLVIFLLEGKRELALLLFIVAGISDALDGFLARVLKQKTNLGAYIDPIADKLLLNTSYVTLAILELLPSWLAVLVVSRDVIIVIGIIILLLNNKPLEIKPTVDSKITTFMQLLAVCFYLAVPFIGPKYASHDLWLLIPTALLTIYSGLHYIAIGFSLLGTNGRNNHATE